jgi:hypothetical protein
LINVPSLNFARSFLNPFFVSAARRRPRADERGWIAFLFPGGCSCGPLWQECTPPSKSVMQIQPSTVKLTPKRKRLSEAAAPRARTKTRKILVKKVRKEAVPSSPNPSSPVINQDWPLLPLCNRVLFMSPLMLLSSLVACRCRSLQRGGAPMPERLIFGSARGRGCAYQGLDHSP